MLVFLGKRVIREDIVSGVIVKLELLFNVFLKILDAFKISLFLSKNDFLSITIVLELFHFFFEVVCSQTSLHFSNFCPSDEPLLITA